MSGYSLSELESVVDSAIWSFDCEISLRTDYSGRGMFSDTCVGIVGDSVAAFGAFCAVLARSVEDGSLLDSSLLTDVLADVRTDSMGLNTIWYFPEVWVKDDALDLTEQRNSTA